jgi:dTDP-4-amino-4,6-dideoxygalactose transaminase
MVPFLDLKGQYNTIRDEIRQAIDGVLESCQYALGSEVAAFEKEFAAYCQTQYAVGVNSGTSALHLALLAAGVGPGDVVITVSHTFVATVSAIYYTRATPVLIEIDPVSFTMDPAKIEAAITPRTKVIMPVHLYGQPADMDPILEIAKRRKLIVIEDAAQAHGAEYKGRRCGSMGDMACFSFYPGKNLGAYGEGGAVVTNNAEYNRVIRMLRDWGAEKKYHHVLKGYNYRMEGIQGAVLRVKLRRLQQWNDGRRVNAARYAELLKGSGVGIPREMPYAHHVYHVYAVRTKQREALQQYLQARQIQSGIHYPIPVHLLEAYRDLGYAKGSLPITEQAADEVLSLPMCAELSAAQLQEVAEAIRGFHAQK